ncbi:hypothetical protein KJ765_04985 [Candidatus Micrarchaeota archaeon]|nr:hypothetical protein [Candidatus Micrarchaeota archaeon]
MESVSVAVIGGDDDAADVLYSGLREFPASKVVLIAEEKGKRQAEQIKKDLEKFKIPSVIEVIQNKASMEDVFAHVARIREREVNKRITMNVDTDYRSSCIALSAAFVNGIQAIGVLDEKIIAYPIMKFSYYTALSERKISLLKTLFDQNGVDSLEMLSRLTGMSLPLATYHVRGSRNKPGLEELGLVKTNRHGGRLAVGLTPLGRLISKGYVDVQESGRERKKDKRRGKFVA